MAGGARGPPGGARGLASGGKEGLATCLQGLKERAYASGGEAITSLPVSIPLSTVQPSKLPVSIPLASVVLPSRAERVVSGRAVFLGLQGCVCGAGKLRGAGGVLVSPVRPAII